MLRANGTIPRNPEPLEPQEHTRDTSRTSETFSGKGDSEVKKDSGSETDDSDDDSDSMREKALLVCI